MTARWATASTVSQQPARSQHQVSADCIWRSPQGLWLIQECQHLPLLGSVHLDDRLMCCQMNQGHRAQGLHGSSRQGRGLSVRASSVHDHCCVASNLAGLSTISQAQTQYHDQAMCQSGGPDIRILQAIMVVMACGGLTYLWHGKMLPGADTQCPSCPARHAPTQSEGLAHRPYDA